MDVAELKAVSTRMAEQRQREIERKIEALEGLSRDAVEKRAEEVMKALRVDAVWKAKAAAAQGFRTACLYRIRSEDYPEPIDIGDFNLGRLDPTKLVGVARVVYDALVDAGLNPQIESRHTGAIDSRVPMWTFSHEIHATW